MTMILVDKANLHKLLEYTEGISIDLVSFTKEDGLPLRQNLNSIGTLWICYKVPTVQHRVYCSKTNFLQIEGTKVSSSRNIVNGDLINFLFVTL